MANQMGLGEVIRLDEGIDAVIECKTKHRVPCRLAAVGRLKGVLDEAAAAFCKQAVGWFRAEN